MNQSIYLERSQADKNVCMTHSKVLSLEKPLNAGSALEAIKGYGVTSKDGTQRSLPLLLLG